MCDSLTFQVLFESIQLLTIGDSGHSVMPTVLVLLSARKGKWKGLELDADVSLSVSLGYRYIWFNLPIASSSKPLAKHPCHSSVLDVLPANATSCLESQNYFPKKFILTG